MHYLTEARKRFEKACDLVLMVIAAFLLFEFPMGMLALGFSMGLVFFIASWGNPSSRYAIWIEREN